LNEFIQILERGITEHENSGFEISPRLKEHLLTWIEEEKEYIN
jgi:hypothetical protein